MTQRIKLNSTFRTQMEFEYSETGEVTNAILTELDSLRIRIKLLEKSLEGNGGRGIPGMNKKYLPIHSNYSHRGDMD